jgi:Acyltransferase C-terminus
VGYDGSLPPSIRLSAPSLWSHLRRTFPREIHVRIKRYSMEEVLQDRSWLDKRWAEKDRLLSHFARHQSFPVDGRGYARHRVLDSRLYSVEGSMVSIVRLLLVPFAVPLLLLLSIPLVWTVGWIWLVHKIYRLLFPDPTLHVSEFGTDIAVVEESAQTPGSSSAGTPYMPATPFASPSVTSWRDLFAPLNNGSSSGSSGGGAGGGRPS